MKVSITLDNNVEKKTLLEAKLNNLNKEIEDLESNFSAKKLAMQPDNVKMMEIQKSNRKRQR